MFPIKVSYRVEMHEDSDFDGRELEIGKSPKLQNRYFPHLSRAGAM